VNVFRPNSRRAGFVLAFAALAVLCCSACSTPAAADKKDTAGDIFAKDGAGLDAPASDGAGTDVNGADTATGDASSNNLLIARPLRFDHDLYAVWGTAPDDVWVVGEGIVLHHNGKTFAPLQPPTKKTSFRGVGGKNKDDVWIVGDGVLLHWDGKALSDATTLADKANLLSAVHASPDGSMLVAAGQAGLVLKYQDGKWKEQQTNAQQTDLHGIWAVGPGQVWAVGDKGQALKLAGGFWTPTSIPKATKNLNAVAASPGGRLFTCGDGGYLGATNNGTWEATLANDPQSRSLFSMWAQSDTEAWALGDEGALLHYLGKKWNLEEIAGTYMKVKSFRGMWGIPPKKGDAPFALAVGLGGAGVALKDGKWQDFRAETVADLLGIAAKADGGFYACGQGGLLLEAKDAASQFYDLAAPVTAADLYDVVDAGGAWAVGAGGVVVHDGVAKKVPGGKDLRGIAKLGSDGLIAVGDGGTAFLIGMGINAAVPPIAQITGTQLPLRSVASTPGVAFAVGDIGTILRRDTDGKWTPEDSGETANLVRVIAWNVDDAMAISDSGLILLRQNGLWKKVFDAPGLFLYGATRRVDGTLIAVGWAGTLVVGRADAPFQKLPDTLPNILFGVASSASGTVAVGKKGGVYTVAEKLP